MSNKIHVSPLGHTWVFDLDGTVVKHNGYLIDGSDTLLTGAREFFSGLAKEDMVIFLTARDRQYADATEKFLDENGIRFDHILYEIPYGERILINDRKPSGLDCAIAVNTIRDEFMSQEFFVDPDL